MSALRIKPCCISLNAIMQISSQFASVMMRYFRWKIYPISEKAIDIWNGLDSSLKDITIYSSKIFKIIYI